MMAASEGRHWRYEVCEHEAGYLVQMRDLETGDVDHEFATIFRTMPVALAYADMSAALDRFAAAEQDDEADGSVAAELQRRERAFEAVSQRLHDRGVKGATLRAWAQAHARGHRKVYH
jgi:hypothetical protein